VFARGVGYRRAFHTTTARRPFFAHFKSVFEVFGAFFDGFVFVYFGLFGADKDFVVHNVVCVFGDFAGEEGGLVISALFLARFAKWDGDKDCIGRKDFLGLCYARHIWGEHGGDVTVLRIFKREN